MNKYFDSYM